MPLIERAWRDKNIFVRRLIAEHRALPLYWQILSKRGSSNLQEQQLLIPSILSLLKNYQIVILGDREFGSVKLVRWLCEKNVRFVLRVKQGQYIQKEGEEFKRLSECSLVPEAFILGELKSPSKKDLVSLISRVIGDVNMELVVKIKAGICSQI